MATTPPEQKLAKATFPNMLERFKGEIARALPRHLNPDRMARIALTCFRQNPRLAECDPRSVFASVIQASQLGLEPGILGQAYLIPYKTECQLIIGYQGLVDLTRRSGLVKRIEAHVVRQGEKFTYRTGLHTVLEHEPLLEGTPGALRLAYAVAEFADGGYHAEVMAEDQINRIRDRSQGYIAAKKYNKDTPWETDTEEMWRKTVLRRICKYLPKSPELVTALQLDEAAAQGRQALTVEDAIAGTWEAPVLEVTTAAGQDERLAEKSKANLEEIKEKYAQQIPSPPTAPPAEGDPMYAAYQEKLRVEAERQKAEVAAKYGAGQPSSGDAAAAAESPAAPIEKQEAPTGSGLPTPPAGAEAAPVVSAPPEQQEEQHGLALEFEKPKTKKGGK